MNASMSGRRLAALSCLWASLSLTACGGSDDNGAPPPPPPASPTTLPTSVTINGPAIAEAGSTASISSSLTTTTGIVFSWDFGDGSAKAATTTATHTWMNAGDYVVTLTVTNTAGDSRTATLPVSTRHFANVSGLTCTGADSTGWCWQDVRTTPHKLYHFTFVDKDHGWGVGDNGTIVHTVDGGSTWTPQASGTTDFLVDVRFADPLHGLVLTSTLGAALQTADGGATWTGNSLGGLLPNSLGAVDTIVRHDSGAIVINRTQYQVGDSKAIVSHDGGATWLTLSATGPLIAGADCWWVGAGPFPGTSAIDRSAGCGATSANVPLDVNQPTAFEIGRAHV